MIVRVPYRWRLAVLGLACSMVMTLAPRARCAEPAKVVVFVVPSGVDLDAALRDALTAQLSGGGTGIVFERFSAEASSLRRQVLEARGLSSRYSSVGVFWLDAPADKDWLLYLAEPGGDRVLVRRITVEAEGSAAATEAVAVITSESTEALAHGQTLGMQPVVLPPETPAPIEPAARPPSPPAKRLKPPAPVRPHGASITLAYYGDSPATEISWQSGARFALSYRAPIGLYAGAGYVFFKEANVKGPDLAFHVSRTPLDAVLGVALPRSGFRLAAELRTIVELLTRENVSAASTLASSPSSTRAVVLLSPRFRVEQDVHGAFSLYAAGGIDVALNPFSFVSRVDGEDRPLLRPARIRPAIEAGALIWL